MTPIDRAHAALEADPEDAGARLAFYGRVLEAELWVVLEEEPEDHRLRPLVLEAEGARHVLAFDLPERMGGFLDAPEAYAAMAGRSLVAMLAGQGIGVLLNPGAPSASAIGAEAVDWLASPAAAPEAREARIAALRAPAVDAGLVAALEARLGAYAGALAAGHLAAAEYEDGSAGLVLALVGLPETAEAPVAAAVDEAVRFSGVEAVRLDVLFLRPDAPIAARIAQAGLTFRPEPPEPGAAVAPGSDPGQPPRLR